MRHFINYIKNDDFIPLINFGIKIKEITLLLVNKYWKSRKN